MKDQLIEKFNEFNEESHYQKIDESINVILNSYTDLRRNTSLKPDEKQNMESELNERISEIIYSSGMSSESGLPFDMEREFFTNGELDEKRYDHFKRRLLQHRSGEEHKWIFAGTSMSYTGITQRTLEAENRRIDELLPKDLLKEKDRTASKKIKPAAAGSHQVFVYPDGALSSVYEPSRARFSFDRTRDRSGVPWGSAYHADLVVEKQNWDSGFNSNGEWERFTFGENTRSSAIDTKSPSPIISFEPRINDFMEYIYIIDLDDKSGVLCDEAGLLVTEQNEQFFSFSGELYAERKTDPEASAEKLIKDLEQKGMSFLSEIIVPDISEETRSAYKNILGNMVTEQTIFRAAADPETHTVMLKLRENIIENRASAEIIRKFSILQKQGYTGNELYSGLEHERVTPVIEQKLSLFTNKKDLEVFVSLPVISEAADTEAINYLQELHVPEEKAPAMSNAVQNLLHDYKNLFQYTGLTRKDVITHIYETIVLGRNDKSSKVIIPGECTLSDYIRQQAYDNRSTTVPAYHSSRTPADVPNIFSDDGFIEWQREFPDLLHDEVIPGVKKILRSANIEQPGQSTVSSIIISTFMEFKAIQENTGTTPEELIKLIITEAKGKPDNLTGNKKILFSKNLEKLIYEASTGTKHTSKVSKNSFINSPKSRVKISEFDLFNDEDFMEFVSTPEFAAFGLSTSEVNELSSAIKEISLSERDKYSFTRNLGEVLPFYKSTLSAQGYSINKLIHENASYTSNKSKSDEGFVRFLGLTRVMESSNTPSENYIFLENFPSTVTKETAVKELKSALLSESQISTLLEQYKHEYTGFAGKRLSRHARVYENIPVDAAENTINFTEPGISGIGWKKIRKKGLEEPRIIRIQQSAGKKAPRIMTSARQDAEQNQEAFQSFPGLHTNNIEALNNRMIYTSPAVRPSGWTSAINQKITDNISPEHNEESAVQIHKQHSGYDPMNNRISSDDEDSRMQRIIENYNSDRRKLAKSDGGETSSGQGTAGGKGNGGGDLKKTIEALYNEFKKDVEKTI